MEKKKKKGVVETDEGFKFFMHHSKRRGKDRQKESANMKENADGELRQQLLEDESWGSAAANSNSYVLYG